VKTITYEEFIKFNPCWLNTEAGRKRLKYYATKKEHWSALDILALEKVSPTNRLWAILREELLDTKIMHEFACQCAEEALKLVNDPDKRSVAAIKAKRDWLNGKITNDELAAAKDAAANATWTARNAAWGASAAAWAAANDAARVAARDAVLGANDAAGDAVWAAWAAKNTAKAATLVTWSANDPAWNSWGAAKDAADAAVWEKQVEILINLLEDKP